MKLAIVGSRSFTDFDLFKSKIDEFIFQNVINKKDIIIISGGAKGTDSLAKRYAIENDIEIIEYLPDWNLYGKSAGMVRNMDIVKNCDKLIAFSCNNSKGTEHSIQEARKLNKDVIIFRFDDPKINEIPNLNI
jgi:hypothetical protein